MNELIFLMRLLFGAILRAFFPAVFDEMKDSFRERSEDASSQPALKQRLQQRIRSRWGKAAMFSLALPLCLMSSGCGTRTVYVPDGEPVRLRADIKKAKIWVIGADGKPIATHLDLAEGWYVVPDSGEEIATETLSCQSTIKVK